MRLEGHELSREAANGQQLLALPALRRRVEPVSARRRRITPAGAMRSPQALEQTVTDLSELIDAIDRRLPQVERSGEAEIARSAARLRDQAMRRLDALRRDAAARPSAGPRLAKTT